jgi:hypothetical protein
VKGQAERALLELSKTTLSLKPYSARQAVVDVTYRKEIHPFIPRQKQLMIPADNAVLLLVFRAVYTKMVSPTKELGQALVDLAMSDGRPLPGKGILDEGRTISNIGIRRLARIRQSFWPSLTRLLFRIPLFFIQRQICSLQPLQQMLLRSNNIPTVRCIFCRPIPMSKPVN